jgi:hypothetical protein
MEGLGVVEKVKIVPRTHLNFPIRSEMCYRRANWSSATTAAATTDLEKIRTELERGGKRGDVEEVRVPTKVLGFDRISPNFGKIHPFR